MEKIGKKYACKTRNVSKLFLFGKNLLIKEAKSASNGLLTDHISERSVECRSLSGKQNSEVSFLNRKHFIYFEATLEIFWIIQRNGSKLPKVVLKSF